MVNGVFSQSLRHIRITNTSNKLFTSKNIPDLHFRVDSKHHGKYGRGIPQLMSCLLQPFFQVFIYKPVCFPQDRLVCFYIYRTCIYLGVSLILLSQAMSVLLNLERIKARRKGNSKETRCNINLTKSLDSVDLSQQTRQVTVPSHSETNLGLLA